MAPKISDHAAENGGAGGNRTPVHQPLSARDTTIPTVVLSQHRRRVDYLVT